MFKNQGGFTLIEMLVVIGIIAALAAVIVPNIGKFIGSGEAGAQDAEQGSVETAISAMMSEQSLIAVDAPTNSTQDWIAEPQGTGAVPLWSSTPGDRYIQDQITSYFYCWNTQGNVTNASGDASRIASLPC